MKRLYLIRGLPGSGKSTLATTIAPNSSVAADDWFDKTQTEWHPKHLQTAHEWCRDQVNDLMLEGADIIAVHNCFVQRWSIKPYEYLAAEFGYSFCVVEMKGKFENLHEVPPEKVAEMREKWERWNN